MLLELPAHAERSESGPAAPAHDVRVDQAASHPYPDELPPGGFPWAFAGAVLLLLGVELAVRFADARDVIPYELGRQEYGAVTGYIDALGPAEVSFVGSSHTREGIIARDVRKRLRRAGLPLEVANYAVSSARAETVEAVVNRILMNGERKPRVILYGLAPRDLRSAFPDRSRLASLWSLADWYRDFRAAPSKAAPHLPEVLRNQIGRWYLTLRYRDAVRLRLNRWLKDEPATPCPILGDDLSPWHHDDRSLRDRTIPPAQIEAYVQHNRLDRDGSAPSDRRMQAALLRMAKRCNEAGVQFILFEMPISDALLGHMPDGIYDGFLAIAQDLARQASVPFVTQKQLSLQFKETQFREHSHLNHKGARLLSRAIAEQIIIPAMKREQQAGR